MRPETDKAGQSPRGREEERKKLLLNSVGLNYILTSIQTEL